MHLKHSRYRVLTIILVVGLGILVVGFGLPNQSVLGHGSGEPPVGPPLSVRSAAQLPDPGSFVNFETPHVYPLDINDAATFVAACNTPGGYVEIFSVDGASGNLTHVDSIRVGYAPVSVRFRTDDEIWVVNHLSDTISVVSISGGDVTQTIHTYDGYNGTHAGDEPTDVVFVSTGHALVSGSRSDVIQRYTASTGAYVDEFRLDGEDPRMLATNAANTSAYAAIFESGNGSTLIQGADVSNFFFPAPDAMNDPSNLYSGANPPFNNGIPGSAWVVDGVSVVPGDLTNPAPEVALIVKKDAGGAWRDDNNADWSPYITGVDATQSGRFPGWDLLDNDVAVLTSGDSFTSATYATRQMNHVMAVAVDPATGEVFSVGTDATNEIRFEPNITGTFTRVMLAVTNAAGAIQHLVDLNEEHLDSAQGGVGLAYSDHTVPQGDRDNSIGDPRGIAFKGGASVAYISGMGSNNVVVVNTSDGTRIGTNGEHTIEVGEGPTGIVHHPSKDRLYVLNKFDSTVTTVNTTSIGAETTEQTLPFYDPTPDFINTGRKHLYSTHDNSGLGQIACASCHIDSRMDRLAWDLGNPAGGTPQGVERIINTADILSGNSRVWNFLANDPDGEPIHTMKGPMTTTTLQDIIGHEPFHWRGDRDGIEEFADAFSGLQGADQALGNILMQEFEDFLSTIHFTPNPFRALDNSLPGGPSLVGGGSNPTLPMTGHVSPGFTLGSPPKSFSTHGTPLPNGNAWQGFDDYVDLFLDSGSIKCVTCHALPMGSGPVTTLVGLPIPLGPNGQAHVGLVTIDGTGQPHIKVPQTRNQFDKEGFFLNQAGPGTADASLNPSRAGFGLVHNGNVDGIARFLGEPVFQTVTDQDLADIVAFTLCINGGDFSDLFALTGGPAGSSPDGGPEQTAHAAMGHQVTITSSSPAVADQNTIDLLVTLANDDKVGLIVTGAVSGNRASWYHVSGTGPGALFQRDENSSPLESLSTIQGFAAIGDSLTFMAVPMVSEVRMGVDRDGDGSFNRTEILNATDPADPMSFPGGPGDFNGDGFVDASDLAIWEANFGQPVTGPVFNGLKFLEWQRNLTGPPAVMALAATGEELPPGEQAAESDSSSPNPARAVSAPALQSGAATGGGTNLRLLIIKARLREASKNVRLGKTQRAERSLQVLLDELTSMSSNTADTDPQRKRIKQIETSVKKQLAKISGG